MLIDSHSHIHNTLDFGELKTEDILTQALINDVRKIVVIGTSYEDSLAARGFQNEWDGYKTEKGSVAIFWTYGVHPSEFEKTRQEPDFDSVRPIAIGEVGLDYHYGPEFYTTDTGPFAGRNLSFAEIKQEQIKLLEEMLDLAARYDLPVSFHVREAFDDFLGVVKNFPKTRGVIHSFSDNKKNLARVLEAGFYVGVNGMATYSTLPLPPLERTLTETDAPYLAPVPHRHEINQPAYIKNVVEWLATAHQTSVSKVAEAVSNNAKDLFGI